MVVNVGADTREASRCDLTRKRTHHDRVGSVPFSYKSFGDHLRLDGGIGRIAVIAVDALIPQTVHRNFSRRATVLNENIADDVRRKIEVEGVAAFHFSRRCVGTQKHEVAYVESQREKMRIKACAR
jgi:hypothetical protein